MKDTFNLEGLFNKEDPNQEEVLPFSEKEILNYLIKGSEYEPNDIIAIAFGEANEKQNRKAIDGIFLTERGLKESGQKDLKEKYYRLNELSKVGKLTDFIKDKSFVNTLANLFLYAGLKKYLHSCIKPLKTEYYDLGGSDGKKRIIKMYITD